MSYVSRDTVFAFLVNSYGTVAIFVYVLIAFSQLRLRARLEREDPARLGLSYIITAGNEAVTGVGDYVSALADDPRVKLILLFLETIRDPAGLAASAKKARDAGQTILAMKVGRSERARAAVNAHSGALSGEDRVVDAYFRQLGIVRARDLDDLVQIARLKLGPPPRLGAQPAYITLSGGQGAALADAAADAGLPG